MLSVAWNGDPCAGASVSAVGDDGMTPLMGAAKVGHVEIVQRLLTGGADIEAADSSGTISLIWAVMSKTPGTLNLLTRAGAKLDHRAWKGFTALMHAAIADKTEAVKALLTAGADPEIKKRRRTDGG